MTTRLNKHLADHGIASRRHADELISKGAILVNGQQATLGMQIDPTHDIVTVRGKNLAKSAPLTYYLLHKPAGVVSTTTDPQGRRTVLDLIPSPERLYPVGRLDFDSEGLILLTNDGSLTYRLTHPKFEITKTYKVLVKGSPKESALKKLSSGVVLDGKKSAPAVITPLESQPGRTWLRFVIHEGRNRQIRKMCQAVGHPVIRLIRLTLGPYELGDLKPGDFQSTTNKLK